MSSCIPPALEPYLAFPEESTLTLFHGILGASTNWFLLRYLYSLLQTKPAPRQSSASASPKREGSVGVVLVSFLRDFNFWRDGASRLGVNLEALGTKGRFVFVDGLSRLFLPGGVARDEAKPGHRTIQGSALEEITDTLHTAVDELSKRCDRVVLVLDQPDALLAAAGPEMIFQGMQELILDLREVCS
jgi:elongator complex protein 6